MTSPFLCHLSGKCNAMIAVEVVCIYVCVWYYDVVAYSSRQFHVELLELIN